MEKNMKAGPPGRMVEVPDLDWFKCAERQMSNDGESTPFIGRWYVCQLNAFACQIGWKVYRYGKTFHVSNGFNGSFEQVWTFIVESLQDHDKGVRFISWQSDETDAMLENEAKNLLYFS